ncbi:UvrB/UvrC motif-containing protein [candidate division KSB1 bacterium]|nr:UvrB/UvrC motif-containing protein [candidate division KSB1 bacterium]
MAAPKPEKLKRACPKCGTTFDEFAQTAAFGCAHCYEVFADLLDPVLRRMHGVTRRNAPDATAPEAPTVRVVNEDNDTQTKLDFMVREDIEMELQLALLEENYEKAARLRDRLKEL